jgi:molybdate-binding protein/DNA-binding XRE family transcriptional regulator
MFQNHVRAHRSGRGWSQDELARRSGLSRAGVSAIETGRLVPSTAAALVLAAALDCAVEDLFHLKAAASSEPDSRWAAAWNGGAARCRYWRAEVSGRRLLFPVEPSPLGLLPHDGVYEDEVFHDHAAAEPGATLVLACCDPAVAFLAALLARADERLRLIVLPRSSRVALELLAQGLVHAAGVHLASSDSIGGNETAAREHLSTGVFGRAYRLLRVADWDEGIALAAGQPLRSIKAVLGARLRWVEREPGSGAAQCLEELLGRSSERRRLERAPWARDHRGVAEAIRGQWADAGICLRLASEEAGLSFLSVRQEAYEICFPEALAGDPRIKALVQVVRSAAYRRTVADLPGYSTTQTGELRRFANRPT